MKKTVRVTRHDIRQGKLRDDTACPVARAVKRAFPRYDVFINDDTVSIFRSDSCLGATLTLPLRAREFVHRFDTLGRQYVRPFHFEMEV